MRQSEEQGEAEVQKRRTRKNEFAFAARFQGQTEKCILVPLEAPVCFCSLSC